MNRRQFIILFFVLLFSGKLFKVFAAEKKRVEIPLPKSCIIPAVHSVYIEDIVEALKASPSMIVPPGSEKYVSFYLEKYAVK